MHFCSQQRRREAERVPPEGEAGQQGVTQLRRRVPVESLTSGMVRCLMRLVSADK
jgi:hypothetical protein